MLYLDLRRILNDKGIEKHNTFLQKLGIPAYTASKLLHNNVTSVNLTYISRICVGLNCTPAELFTWKDDARDTLPAGHALQKLKLPENKSSIAGRIRQLAPEQMEQLKDYLENLETTNAQ